MTMTMTMMAKCLLPGTLRISERGPLRVHCAHHVFARAQRSMAPAVGQVVGPASGPMPESRCRGSAGVRTAGGRGGFFTATPTWPDVARGSLYEDRDPAATPRRPGEVRRCARARPRRRPLSGELARRPSSLAVAAGTRTRVGGDAR